LAIARALRELRPELEIVWLAQHPVTKVLEAAGELVHPASRLMANESAHIESEMGEHDLHVFQAWREMDEILLANFMLFHDVVRDDRYDLWLGDESWELDYYLHENPELKAAPYVFMTDFVGWLPIDDSPGSREAYVAADYNHENIRHVERYPYVRDSAVFVGTKRDIVPRHFGPELPFMPDWIERHFDFPGYVLPFDPADYADTERLRREPGHDPRRPLIVASVGGSGVGIHLLRRIAAAFERLREDVPEARLLLVCGPAHRPRHDRAGRGDGGGRLCARRVPRARLLRPGGRAGRPDHDDGARRQSPPVHLHPAAKPLRAEPSRRPPPAPLRRAGTDALRPDNPRAARRADARAPQRPSRLRAGRSRRRHQSGTPDRTVARRAQRTHPAAPATPPSQSHTRLGRSDLMQHEQDKPASFHSSPQEAMQSAPEEFLYLALLHEGMGVSKSDFLAVVDAEEGRIVHEKAMPNVGDELHHYGWNRCSSACHGPDRSYLIVPGFRARALMRGSWGGGSNR
jgi:hypothetical protein